MEGALRREKIIEILQRETAPVSGAELAGRTGVSRQVIVIRISSQRTEDIYYM